jgi:hypothetical protein
MLASYNESARKYKAVVADWDSAYYFSLGSTSICDTNGKLLLLSNCFNLFTANMQHHGTKYQFCDSILYNYQNGKSNQPQSALILPLQGNKYVLITATVSDSAMQLALPNLTQPADKLRYYSIEMNDEGSLKSLSPGTQLSPGIMWSRTQMMACRHGNGKDWWLLKRTYAGDAIYTYRFNTDGTVQELGLTAIPWLPQSIIDLVGTISFNSTGTEFACARTDLQRMFFRCSFDRCSGAIQPMEKLSPPIYAQDSFVGIIDSIPRSCVYSPNGRFVYLARFTQIVQIDLQDTNEATRYHKVCDIDTSIDRFMGYSTMYVGLNGQIFIGNWGGLSTQMSTIDQPNLKGAACSFCARCFRYDDTAYVAMVAPPNLPDFQLGKRWCGEDTTSTPTQWHIYPNPATDILYIDVPDSTATSIEVRIINAAGQLVSKGMYTVSATHKAELSISHLARACYFVQVVHGEQRVTKKVLKI